MKNIINYNKKQEIIKHFTDLNLEVIVNNCKNHHLTIIGEKRKVELYPTTGTVNCGRTGTLKQCTYRDMELTKALRRVFELATMGY